MSEIGIMSSLEDDFKQGYIMLFLFQFFNLMLVHLDPKAHLLILHSAKPS